MSTAVVPSNAEQELSVFFEPLDLSADRVELLKNLTHDLVDLEAARGSNTLQIGRKLKQIRTLLIDSNDGSKEQWQLWCKTFGFTADYVNRMIHVADVFTDGMPGLQHFSLQHLREIARFSDNQEDRVRLAQVAEQHKLGSKQLRYLVSETKKEAINLDEIIAEHPDLRSELDRRMKRAKDEGKREGLDSAKDEITQLKSQLESEQAKITGLTSQFESKNKKLEEMAARIRLLEASDKVGEGNVELGELRIQKQQLEAQVDNLKISLTDVQKAMQQTQYRYDTLVNSPLGQAKLDLRKVMDDITKFFKDTMTPAYVQMRAGAVNSVEAQVQVAKVAEVVGDWAENTKQLLAALPITIDISAKEASDAES